MEKLEPCVRKIGPRPFDRAIGTSATAAALASSVHRIPGARREEADRKRVTQAQVRSLYKTIRGRDLAARRKMTGVGPLRAEILIPGVAVFLKAMEAFRLTSLYYLAAKCPGQYYPPIWPRVWPLAVNARVSTAISAVS